QALKSQGVYLAVATAKPLEPSRRILEHFRLAQYFDAIVGPDMSVKHAEKDELIRKARGDFKGKCAMVGDRCFDVEGANRVGIDSIGVGYGYGDYEELTRAGCTHYAATVEELYNLLCPGVKKKGWFVSMEGGDGCGKTTQARLLRENLERFGYEVYATREPGGCSISEKIRNILLDVENMEMAPVTEAILYAASRAQHVQQVIRPKVREGKLVLCDRFVDSSVAYQGGGRQLGVEKIMQINAPAVDGCMPDMTVYLAMDHKQALMRRLNASEPDRLEMESVAFHGRIHEAYEVLIQKEPERFLIVDAAKGVDEVAQEALQKVLERLE
ncbi:MAG: dTMP kinase, partial [Clostridia bacterium]|nr:dTMP kinase [Clostridia bacterium]